MRRNPAARLTLLRLMAVTMICLPGGGSREQQADPAAGARGKGKARMQLQLSVSPQHAEVVAGETIPVVVEIVNAGQAPAQAPSPQAPNAFEFNLRSAADGTLRLSLSADAALAQRSHDPRPARPVPMVALAPGASQRYEDDIARFAVSPVPPGNYRLSVVHRATGGPIESPGAPLLVVPPRVLAMATVVGSSVGQLGHVIAHAQASGRTVVLQRESRAGVPGDGIWYRRVELIPPAKVGGVGVAVELERSRGVRWFSWLQGDAAGAGVAEYATLYKRVDPLPLGLRGAVLYPVGWQPTQESASFAALGLGPGGRVSLAAATFAASGTGSVKRAPLAATAVPGHWAVRRRSWQEPAQFDVVWTATDGGWTRIRRQGVTPEAGTAEPPVMLAERAEPLAALAVAPVAGSSPGVVDALFGPFGGEGKMLFLRLPLDHGAKTAEWTFDGPKTPDEARPTDWTITATPLDDPAVLVKLGDNLLVRRLAAGSGWSTLAEHASSITSLRLVVLGDASVWAIWADPVAGIRYCIVP